MLFSIVHDVTPRILAEEEAQRNRYIAYFLLLVIMLLLGTTLLIVNRSRIRENKVKEEIERERSLLKTILHSIAEGVIVVDQDGKISFCNPVAESLTGCKNEQVKGQSFSQVFHLMDEFQEMEIESSIVQVLKNSQLDKIENRAILINKKGDAIPIEELAAPIKDESGKLTGAVTTFRDYSEKKKEQEKIYYLSYHDQLTGLYNRHFFEEEIKRLDIEANLPLTLALIDINGLKLTNDALGHQAGDQLLKIVAQILSQGCRKKDIVARIGGDEFLLIMPNTSDDQAGKVIERIDKQMQETELENIIVSASIGWETKVGRYQDMEEVFSKAEDAMYQRKMTESQIMRQKTIEMILKRLDKIDKAEGQHAQTVVTIAAKIGQLMGLNEKMIEDIKKTARLHDIGKITVSKMILQKEGSLSKREYDEIKRHAETGYQMLKTVDEYANVAEYVLFHHERWDGTGYPKGLAGEEIPLISRIIAVAEAFESMTTDKPYRSAMSQQEALSEIKKFAGQQFDPEIVRIWSDYLEENAQSDK